MRIIHLARIDSTNDEAKRRIDAGLVDGLCAIIAGEQTAGRGTRGRSWSSPAGAGLYLSLVDARQGPDRRPVTTLYTLAAGVAVAEVIREQAGVDVRLKPVNDLILRGAKIGGILTESLVRGDRMIALVVGVGVNLRRAPRFVEPGAVMPTSLEEHLDASSVDHLIEEGMSAMIIDRLVRWIDRVGSDQVDHVLQAWNALRVTGAPEYTTRDVLPGA